MVKKKPAKKEETPEQKAAREAGVRRAHKSIRKAAAEGNPVARQMRANLDRDATRHNRREGKRQNPRD